MRLGSGILRTTVALTAMVVLTFASASAAQTSSAGTADNPIPIDDEEEIVGHWLTSHNQLRLETTTIDFTAVTLSVVVAPDGHVVSAEPIEGPSEYYESAVQGARTWRYKPFEREGRTVYAKIVDYMGIGPREQRAETRVPFPEIRRWNSLRITFSHTYCYSTCASYSVEISGDGTITYEGEGLVAVGGRHQARVSPATVRQLFDAFRAADYFSTLDEYKYDALTHAATITTSITFDGVRKSVTNYAGLWTGLPTAVLDLEYAIPFAADVDKWLQITPQTIPSLIEERYFRRRERDTSILANMIDAGANADMVRVLIALGASINATGDFAGGRRRGTPLMAAAQKGDAGLVNILLAAGAARNDRAQISMALSASARAPSADLARLFLERGADPNVRDRSEAGATPLMYAALRGSPDTVSALLSGGADVRIRDERGYWPLDYAVNGATSSDEDRTNRTHAVRLLVEAGADPNTCADNTTCTTVKSWMSGELRPTGP